MVFCILEDPKVLEQHKVLRNQKVLEVHKVFLGMEVHKVVEGMLEVVFLVDKWVVMHLI